MATDLCPQFPPLLIVPPGHVLLPVTLLQSLHLLRSPGPFLCQCLCRAAQTFCVLSALGHLPRQKSIVCRLPALKSGFLHLLRRPVRKGLFRLGQVKEPVHDVIGDRRHGLSHIAFKGVVLRHLVQPVRHVRDPLHLVGDVGFPRLVEKLRILGGQLGINLVNISMLALADFQLAEQSLAKLVEVRDLGGIRFRQYQLRIFQILPQTGIFPVRPVIHLHGAFRDSFGDCVRPSPCFCVCQLVRAVLAAGNVVIQALQVPDNVAAADLRAVVLYQHIRRLLNGFPVGGHALRPSGLALPVLHPLFQALVLPFQRRQLLGVLRAFQGKLCVVHAVDLCKPVRLVPSGIFHHVYSGVPQGVFQLVAAVVRDHRCQNLVKPNGALGLGFKVFRRQCSRSFVQFLDLLCSHIADLVALVCKRPHNGINGALALCGLHQHGADDLALFKGIVGMGFGGLHDPLCDGADLVLHIPHLRLVAVRIHGPQPPTVIPDFLNGPVRRNRACLQASGSHAGYLPAAFLLRFLHGLYDVFQGVGVMGLSKTAPVAGRCVRVLSIVDAGFPEHAVQLFFNPARHIFVVGQLVQAVLCAPSVDLAFGGPAVLVIVPCVAGKAFQGKRADVFHTLFNSGISLLGNFFLRPASLLGHFL